MPPTSGLSSLKEALERLSARTLDATRAALRVREGAASLAQQATALCAAKAAVQKHFRASRWIVGSKSAELARLRKRVTRSSSGLRRVLWARKVRAAVGSMVASRWWK